MNQSTVHLKDQDTTFDHSATIAHFCELYQPRLFVEYGVAEGKTTRAISPHCEIIWGVDDGGVCDPNAHKNNIPNLEAFKMKTDEFNAILKERKPVIDMAFIDADHCWTSAFRDFEHLWPYMRDNSIVFLHDTYPTSEKFLASWLCNDCYKTPDNIKNKYGGECEILTIPRNPGLTLVRKSVKLPHML